MKKKGRVEMELTKWGLAVEGSVMIAGPLRKPDKIDGIYQKYKREVS